MTKHINQQLFLNVQRFFLLLVVEKKTREIYILFIFKQNFTLSKIKQQMKKKCQGIIRVLTFS